MVFEENEKMPRLQTKVSVLSKGAGVFGPLKIVFSLHLGRRERSFLVQEVNQKKG